MQKRSNHFAISENLRNFANEFAKTGCTSAKNTFSAFGLLCFCRSNVNRVKMAKKDGELTPMMKQFFDLKAKHPDAVLLFRCGDFYETYCEDAVTAAKILGITLTHRNNGYNKGDEMAGFPHHALDTYLPKLVRAGKRVAICDQLEDPKLTKKLVKRGITELVTPGVALSDNVLNYKENNFLAAVHFGKVASGVAFLDISTGEFLLSEARSSNLSRSLAINSLLSNSTTGCLLNRLHAQSC